MYVWIEKHEIRNRGKMERASTDDAAVVAAVDVADEAASALRGSFPTGLIPCVSQGRAPPGRA